MIKMIKERILVEMLNKDAGTSAGGIMLPNAETKNEAIGKVIAVGPAAEGIEPGDKVVYIKSSAVPVLIRGKEHHVFDLPSVLYIDA